MLHLTQEFPLIANSDYSPEFSLALQEILETVFPPHTPQQPAPRLAAKNCYFK